MKWLILIVAVLVASRADAQAIDPRLAPEAAMAAQAEVLLRDKIIALLREQMARREKEWADYSAPLWREEPKVGEAK